MKGNNFSPGNTALLISFVLMLLIACDKNQPVQSGARKEPPLQAPRHRLLDLPDVLNTDVLVPLTVGNWWKYETTTFIPSPEPDRKDSLMLRIFEDTLVTYKGQSFLAAVRGWYIEKEDIVRDRRWLYMNNNEGLNIVGGVSKYDTISTKYVERKFPVNAGDSWKIQELEFEPFQWVFSDTVVVNCIATDEPFETPAGTFQCYVYRYIKPLQHASGKREHFVYYTPGIGMVGWEERSLGEEKFLFRTALYAARIR